MDISLIVTTIFTALFSGGIASLATLRFARQKSKAEADKAMAEVKTNELDNVQEAVKIWREMAETLREELRKSQEDSCKIAEQVESLRKEVVRLTSINSKIVKLLDKITPENLEKMIAQIKSEIHETN